MESTAPKLNRRLKGWVVRVRNEAGHVIIAERFRNNEREHAESWKRWAQWHREYGSGNTTEREPEYE